MDKNKKDKKKGGLGSHLMTIIAVAIGAVCGALMAENVFSSDFTGVDGILRLAVLFIAFYIAMYVQIIVHEGGHLIFGLLSGYKFCSFRVGSIILIKNTDGSFAIKKFKLAGTGGQCLMIPPELVDGVMPYKLFNLGGSIFNLISAVIFFVIGMLFPKESLWSTACMVFAILGIAYAFINGIPMHNALISNDGYNAMSLGKDKEALKAFYVQLKINELQTRGIRLKDMPEDLFEVPSEEDLNNTIIAANAANLSSYMIDKGDLIGAHGYIEDILSKKTAIIGLLRMMLKNDLIFLKIMFGCDDEILSELLDEQQKKFMKSMKSFPSVLRTGYAAAMYKGNIGEAQKALDMFKRLKNTYPYKGDLEGETELIEKAQSKL